MADVVAIRAALQRMGLTAAAALLVTDDQEMNSLEEFAILKEDEVENLCKVIRHPGGTMANPNAGAAGQPATIPNPGSLVSLCAENNLKMMCYYLCYKSRTSRTVGAADVTLENVRAYRDHKEWEENHKDVEAPEINSKDWPRTIDSIEEYLRGCLGVTKIPLAYVVREDVDVPDGDGDAPAGYDSKQDELIARAPHTNNAGEPTATYLADRSKVWELMSELTREHDCWSYVRPAQRTRDGRMAFLGLKGHYLGENNVDNMSAKAESKLQSTGYSGEKRRWNFEKFVKVHVDQHAILEGLTEHSYAGIDERSKVRHLLAGIKTDRLDTVKTRIMSDAVLRSDFDACVNLFQDFIQQSGQEVRDAHVAAFRTGGGGGNGDVEPDMSVEDRYYKKEEYAKLSAAKKLGLKAKRKKRGHKPGKEKNGSGGGGDITLSKRTIKALVTAMKPPSDTEDSDSSDEDEEIPMKEGPARKKQKSDQNRNNKALKRKN